MIKNASILVTGGIGAIGSALSRALLREEVAALTIVDNCSSSDPELCRDILSDPRVRFLQDSVTSEECLRDAFDPAPGIVFHLAANFANQNSIDHPIRDCEVNSLGTARVLEHSRLAKVQRFVFASSSCVYGRTDEFSVNATDFRPETPYAINKLHGEYQVRFYHEYFGMHATILRYFNSFGPGELPGAYRNVIPNFFRLAMQGKALPITGTEKTARDFNFIDNTINATLLATASEHSAGKTYNVGSGKETPIVLLAEAINRITGNSAAIEFKPPRSWDTIDRRCADISRTVEDLGYTPVMDFEKQLEQTYKWLNENERHFPVEK